ncbi:MAG: hypothetical protein HKN44_10205 [Ilumatobacter sp.]|nr:hypothetical protein [Ilumatobacter sp.]
MPNVELNMTRLNPPTPRTTRRRSSLAVLAVAALALTACGDDTTDPGPGTLPPATDVPTTDGQGGYDHPVGADDVVFEYSEVGGFTTREFAFQRVPAILVSGDGRVFTPGAQIAIFPGPMLPAIQVQTITPVGIQRLLAAAEQAGLFADLDYSEETNVADATTAQVEINANGSTWVHAAYALGFPPFGEDETTPERQALADFLAQLGDLPALVGDAELGEPEFYQPEQFVVEALVVDDLSAYGDDVEPNVVDWPADASVRLADLATTAGTGECTLVTSDEFGELFASADQLTFFAEGGQTYQLLVRAALPGDECL